MIVNIDELSASYNSGGAKKRFSSANKYDELFPMYDIPNISCRRTLRVLYGRVSSKTGNPVALREEYLSQLPIQGEHFALDIVSECFSELVDYHQKLLLRGKFYTTDTMFDRLMVEKSHLPAFSLYERHYREVLHDEFFTRVPAVARYNEFETHAVNTLKELAVRMPVTFSEFLTSKMTAPNVSGLVIDLKDQSHSNDQIKYKKYLRDKNYPLFKKVAKRFGFIIDQHAPWRLFFNLRSPYSIGKMTSRGILHINDFFDRYYQDATELDYDAVSNFVYSSYVQYKQHSDSLNITPASCGDSNAASNMSIIQEPPPLEDLLSNFSKVIESYILIRAYETNKKWNQLKFKKVHSSCMTLYRHKGLDAALKYVSSKFSNRSWEINQSKGLTSGNDFDNIPVMNSGAYTTNINYSGGGGSSSGSGY